VKRRKGVRDQIVADAEIEVGRTVPNTTINQIGIGRVRVGEGLKAQPTKLFANIPGNIRK
jgi:hypothetical protein